MRSIDQIIPQKEVIQPVQEEQKTQIKHIGRLRVKPGHTCFEINTQTKEIEVAEFEKVDIGLFDKAVQKKIIKKPNCVYVTALNKKNALKVFNRGL